MNVYIVRLIPVIASTTTATICAATLMTGWDDLDAERQRIHSDKLHIY